MFIRLLRNEVHSSRQEEALFVSQQPVLPVEDDVRILCAMDSLLLIRPQFKPFQIWLQKNHHDLYPAASAKDLFHEGAFWHEWEAGKAC